jgi:MoxR-like ATPase
MGAVSELSEIVRKEAGTVIVGQRDVIDQCLVTILAGGHALIEGVPGLAKTLAIKTFAAMMRFKFQRVQATPDLMPADITGTNVLNLQTNMFALHHGPIFTDLLLVDEINRMPPRTQAALLESMEERQVTIDGKRHPLPDWFTVFATQNPLEFEGTYPLPEAQLDRFLLKIEVAYPSAEDETQILALYQTGSAGQSMPQVNQLPTELLQAARTEVRNVKVEPALLGYVTRLARKSREHPAINLGASPRAALNLLYVAKVYAAIEARDYLIPDDVKQAVLPVMRHRVVLKPEAALEGVTPNQAISEVVKSVDIPR